MEPRISEEQKVNVNFESHPPIEADLHGITSLLRQTLLQFVDCNELADYLIESKDVTQVIALEAPDEENMNEDDEPDNDIYGVTSAIELPTKDESVDRSIKSRRELKKFLRERCPGFKKILEDDKSEPCLIINERYINLPPQLALPTLKKLTEYIDSKHYTHLVLISKILIKCKDRDGKLPSKKSKSESANPDLEPLIFVNSEEEVIFENCESHADIDVSGHRDENATWSLSNDTKYVPHRRIMVIDRKNWPTIMKELEKELN